MGKIVGEKVASRFGKSILELGGNNAIIISQHANLELALPAVLFGSVGTCGQRCTSTRRLIIHDSIYDKVKELRADPKNAIPPLHGALLKNEQDVHLFEQLVFLDRRSNP